MKRLLAGLSLAILVVSCAGLAPSPILPDSSLTPGDVLNVSLDDICRSGYTQRVRHVSEAVKRQVYAEYGIKSHRPGEYEVDHLISLELGGSNSIKNLWPQSYRTQPWNAHVKDKLENRLHQLVCDHQVALSVAQNNIATDWVEAYKRYMGTSFPKPVFSPAARSDSPGDATTQVWVNTASGKYFLPNSRYFGKTKVGEYMTEPEAQKRGYTKAR